MWIIETLIWNKLEGEGIVPKEYPVGDVPKEHRASFLRRLLCAHCRSQMGKRQNTTVQLFTTTQLQLISTILFATHYI